MEKIVLRQPRKLVFGNGCFSEFVIDVLSLDYKKIFFITAPEIVPLFQNNIDSLKEKGVHVEINDSITSEPSIEMLQNVLDSARAYSPECIVGIGGGSALDVAKLVAALAHNPQKIEDVFGIGLLKNRETPLICLPTTAGTGSEVSPNAILFDPSDQLKKGVVSPYLIADAAYVDPLLTMTVPPAVTAATGLDALTHCIEAYTNKFAHPIIDLYALEGVRLIGKNLERAVKSGKDAHARENMALASLYGGLCLGPVNTAAVHALAYPLGGEFHIAHGISNAVLLPYIMDFNLQEQPKKYANIALALGVPPASSTLETAHLGVEKIRQLAASCDVPLKLSILGIPQDALERMADSAMTVTRLLKNNPREMTRDDALHIYQQAF